MTNIPAFRGSGSFFHSITLAKIRFHTESVIGCVTLGFCYNVSVVTSIRELYFAHSCRSMIFR